MVAVTRRELLCRICAVGIGLFIFISIFNKTSLIANPPPVPTQKPVTPSQTVIKQPITVESEEPEVNIELTEDSGIDPWDAMDIWLKAWDKKNSGPFPKSCQFGCKIPKSIPPRIPPARPQRIGMNIWQTWSSDEVDFKTGDNIEHCVNLNPEYHYRLFDPQDRLDFLKFWTEKIQRSYCGLQFTSGRTDFWKVLAIYRWGGVGLEMDTGCVHPFITWISKDDAFISGLGFSSDPHPWCLIYEAKYPVLTALLNRMMEIMDKVSVSNVLADNLGTDTQTITGAPVLDSVWKGVLEKNGKCAGDLFKTFKNGPEKEGRIDCSPALPGKIHLFRDDFMAGFVKYKVFDLTKKEDKGFMVDFIDCENIKPSKLSLKELP